MTSTEAARLLELPPDATPEQLEARFLELRTKLEDKIAKAPTPGLKAKYRESLEQITTAFETLTLAADSSALPVLQRSSKIAGSATVAGVDSVGTAPSSGLRSQVSGLPAPKSKASNKEFLIVALIAIAVLGVGGWWVVKTRAENAEKERVIAAAKIEAERNAEEARLAADAQKKAEEEEKARVAAAAKAEQERLDKLTGRLRSDLAAGKVEWEAIEREESNAGRRLSELKSDLRSLRDAPAGTTAEAQALVVAHQDYCDWLSATIARHPARIARSRAEELLSARQPDDAQAAMADFRVAMAELEKLVPQQRAQMLDLDGELVVQTEEDVSWSLTDAFGRTHSGKGSARLSGLAVGGGRVELTKPRWPAREEKFYIRRDQPVEIVAEHRPHSLTLRTTPEGAEVWLADGTMLGETPLKVDGFPPGSLTVNLHKEGYYDQRIELTLPAPEPGGHVLQLKPKPTGLVKPERWRSPARIVMEMRSTMTGSSISNTSAVEEWELSKPDPQLGWQQIVRKFISRTGVDRAYVAADGSIMRQQRQPDGKWTGEFIQGGLPNASLNYVWTSMVPSLWPVSLGFSDVWPAKEVAVGETWPVKPEVFFPMIGLVNATGQVAGKLISIGREDGAEWATIEFPYTYTLGGMNGRATLKAHVNLTDCFVTRVDFQEILVHSGGSVNSSYATTFTKR